MSPQEIRIVEVGPRDGLQNEATILSVETKIAFIDMLEKAGLRWIEAGSFVSPQASPQMETSGEVFSGAPRGQGARLIALTPNLRGAEAAVSAGADEIAVFAAASERFSQKNIRCSIDESLSRYRAVVAFAREKNRHARGYVSCAFGCPFEGSVATQSVVRVARALVDLGCYEVSIGDTIGVGTPRAAREIIGAVAQEIGVAKVAIHFHDTYGQALANILACLEIGVTSIDSSAAGLGGCPFAPGAAGNVATEAVIYMLSGLGFDTGVDLRRLVAAGEFICAALGKAPPASITRALARKFADG